MREREEGRGEVRKGGKRGAAWDFMELTEVARAIKGEKEEEGEQRDEE